MNNIHQSVVKKLIEEAFEGFFCCVCLCVNDAILLAIDHGRWFTKLVAICDGTPNVRTSLPLTGTTQEGIYSFSPGFEPEPIRAEVRSSHHHTVWTAFEN